MKFDTDDIIPAVKLRLTKLYQRIRRGAADVPPAEALEASPFVGSLLHGDYLIVGGERHMHVDVGMLGRVLSLRQNGDVWQVLLSKPFISSSPELVVMTGGESEARAAFAAHGRAWVRSLTGAGTARELAPAVTEPSAGFPWRWFLASMLICAVVGLSIKAARTAPAASAAAANADIAQIAAGGSLEGMAPADREKLLAMARVAAGGSAATPPPAQASQGEGQFTLSDAQVATIKAAATLRVHGGSKASKTLIAFEDPMCAVCRDLALSVKDLPDDYEVLVVPIGFQTGGRESAIRALCSKDVMDSWADAMRGHIPDAPMCEAGTKVVDANNQMFLSMGFAHTPILVTPNGVAVKGAGDAKTLAGWIDMNLSKN